MDTKAKGTNAERELIHMFWDKDFAGLRVAGSGSMKYPSPDIIIGNNLRKLAIEVKRPGKAYQHLEKKQIEDLKLFSRIFGAEPWIAVKFKEWLFLTIEDLNKTETSYSITKDTAERKGLSFEQLINF
jgi:Holliday junction resolvase